MKLTEYLAVVFGEDISVGPYDLPEGLPIFIGHTYETKIVSWDGQSCITMHPVSSDWRLPALKKQLQTVRQVCTLPCALELDHLTASQRKNLIENHVPFVIPGVQVYFPFWGCIFSEKNSVVPAPAQKMAPGTQLVFLYLYYQAGSKQMNLTKLSSALNLSKATCSRAVKDLTASGLICTEEEGTNKWIRLPENRQEYLKNGYERLKSPVERVIYVKENTVLPGKLLGGIQALSEISMVAAAKSDGAVIVPKGAASQIVAQDIITRQEFEDFGGEAAEVWSYDPKLLSAGKIADEISLLLSLENETDERIQQGLDIIRRRHGIHIDEEY